MRKKLILIVLAFVSLLVFSDNTFAFGRGPRGRPHQSRFGFAPHRSRWAVIFPRRRTIIRPTIVLGSTTTVVRTVEDQTVLVWITNDNGSKTEVRLVRTADGGYTGPKGEYYSSMPTEEQLKALYGLQCTAPAESNVIVYFKNSDGVETVVMLTKDGSEYVGPKGERYQAMPTEEQLKLIYGK